MSEKCDLSLILACYNEELILKNNFTHIAAMLNMMKLQYEIIFVDDCSQDNTRLIIDEIIRENSQLAIRKIFHTHNEGRGKSVADGLRASSGEVVGYIDVDLEVSPNYIAACYLEIKKNYDICVGWRTYKFYFYYAVRYILSKGYIRLVSILYKTPTMDTESGYKFFKKSSLMPLLDEAANSHWFWDTEIMIRAYYRGLAIKHVPVLFMKRFDKQSTVHVFKDTMEYFHQLIKFRKEVQRLRRSPCARK